MVNRATRRRRAMARQETPNSVAKMVRDFGMMEESRKMNTKELALVSIGEISGIIKWLEKPLVEAAKEEWEELIYLHIVLDRENTVPVIKLCRIHSNKLSRFTSGTPIFFIEGSMQLESTRLRDLLSHTRDIDDCMEEAVTTMVKRRGYRDRKRAHLKKTWFATSAGEISEIRSPHKSSPYVYSYVPI
ncbi:hypothetical protein PtB15_4B765 [Puccinia triticina]|nr:hypothetical protein PtB15_4B765 [Puccinia triticina]